MSFALAYDMLELVVRELGVEQTLQHVRAMSTEQEASHRLPDDALISELEISVRAGNALANYGLKTVGDVRAKGEEWLKRYARHFGAKSLREVKEAIGGF